MHPDLRWILSFKDKLLSFWIKMLKKEILWLLFWSLFIHNIFIYQLKTFSSPEPLGLIFNRPRFPTTWPRNDGLWGLNLVPRVPRGPFYPCRWPKGSRPLGTRLRLCQLESMRIEVMQTTFNCQNCQNSIVFNAWLPVTSKAPKCLMRRLLVWIP